MDWLFREKYGSSAEKVVCQEDPAPFGHCVFIHLETVPSSRAE